MPETHYPERLRAETEKLQDVKQVIVAQPHKPKFEKDKTQND
jgi:hypothetical protein